MIIAKSPLRISIGGGGTDLPSFYSQFESEFSSAAINKYVYIAVQKVFGDEIILKYSRSERVRSVNEVDHPILRECLKEAQIERSIEISSFADIPAGTGLGSSSTFTVALLKALFTYTGRPHTPAELAELACDIEINRLGSPIGKQDQYISSFGGLQKFHIQKSGQVTGRPMKLTEANRTDLEEHLLLFFTGFTRSANELLKEQDEKTRQNSNDKTQISQDMVDNLLFVKELGRQINRAIEAGDLDEFGRLMQVHWENKKRRSAKMSNTSIDQWYELALKNGALGGKVIGAGGGGFLMFLADDKRRLRRAMREAGLSDVPFRFDTLGAQTVLHEV